MTKFIFTNLPPEVRNMIYVELFSYSGTNILIHENERATDHQITASNEGAALLRTSKTVYNEAHRFAKFTKLTFRTEVRNAGYEATEQLPKLGRQLTGSVFQAIETIIVGSTDLWRVIRSLGSLKVRMARLKLIQVIVMKRMPYRYWKEKFPNIVSCLALVPQQEHLVLQACQSDSNCGSICDLEVAKFRCHIRSHPLINEDEYYTDDDEDGYTEDRGNVLFPRFADVLQQHRLDLHLCGRWILVDRNADNAVQTYVRTVTDFSSGRVLEVRSDLLNSSSHNSSTVKCKGPLIDAERRAIREVHLNC